eukprot:1185690-Prorocentrum_minimum.AAC.1
MLPTALARELDSGFGVHLRQKTHAVHLRGPGQPGIHREVPTHCSTVPSRVSRECPTRASPFRHIFSRRTNRTQEAWVYSHAGPIGRRKR